MLKDEQIVRMLNPLSNDLSVMRQSMLFSGLEAVSHNINRKSSDLNFLNLVKRIIIMNERVRTKTSNFNY